jgi:DNA-binding FadR family transcriptional regulator
VNLHQVIEARLVMEPVMAALAARRRSPEMAEELRARVAAGDALVDADTDTYRRASLDYHACVGAASGNDVLGLFDAGLKDIYTERLRTTVYPREARLEIQHDHLEIAEAIIAGDPELAEARMRAHMEEWVKYVVSQHEPRYPQLLDEVIDWQ